jgi:hypothetical protein
MVGGIFQCSSSSQTDGYSDLYTIAAVPPVAWNEVEIPTSPACRFLRYLSPADGYTNVTEIEFWTLGVSGSGIGHTDAGAPLTNLSLGKPVRASSEQTSAGKTADKGNDGLLSTMFCPSGAALPVWYLVDLGAAYPIQQTDITVEKSQAAYQYQIETSTDGSTWTTLAAYQNGASSGGRATLSDSFQAQAQFVRLTITEVSGGFWGCFKEFTVWGYNAPSIDGGVDSR